MRSPSYFTNTDYQFDHTGMLVITAVTQKKTEPLRKRDIPFSKEQLAAIRRDQNILSQRITESSMCRI